MYYRVNSHNEPISDYFGEDESRFLEPYRWPKEAIFKGPPSTIIPSGPYKTNLCPAFNDFLELRNLVRDLELQLGTKPQIPKGLQADAIRRWKETIKDWEKNIRDWEKRISLSIEEMSKRLRSGLYVRQGCTKLYFKDLARQVDSLRGAWTRSGTMLDVRQAIDRRLKRLRDWANRAAR
jgi:hypothetical protein